MKIKFCKSEGVTSIYESLIKILGHYASDIYYPAVYFYVTIGDIPYEIYNPDGKSASLSVKNSLDQSQLDDLVAIPLDFTKEIEYMHRNLSKEAFRELFTYLCWRIGIYDNDILHLEDRVKNIKKDVAEEFLEAICGAEKIRKYYKLQEGIAAEELIKPETQDKEDAKENIL